MPRRLFAGSERPAGRLRDAVEKHRVEPGVVVEVLDVAQVRDGHDHRRVQVP